MKNKIIALIVSAVILISSVPCLSLSAAAEGTCTINVSTSAHGTANPIGVSNVNAGERFLLSLIPDEGYMTESFSLKKHIPSPNGGYTYETTVYDEQRLGTALAAVYSLTLYADYDIFVNFVPITSEMKTVTVSNEGEGYLEEDEITYQIREGGYVRDIDCECAVGFNVSAIYINDRVVYSINSPNLFNSIKWSEDESSFSFTEEYGKVSDDMEIVVTYTKSTAMNFIVSYDTTAGGVCGFETPTVVSYSTGTGDYDSSVITAGSPVKINVTAEPEYEIDSLKINGSDIDSVTGKTEFNYDIETLTKDVFVVASFKKKNIKINVTASGYGRLNVETGAHEVQSGDDFEIIFIPDEGYAIERVLIDGKSDDAARAFGSYKFEDITESHTIAVYFSSAKVTQYTVAVSSGGNGTVLPYGKLTLTSGGYVTFSVVPDEGYILSAVSVNDTNIENPYGNTYFLKNVSRNTRIYFEFEPVPTHGTATGDSDTNPKSHKYGDPDLNGSVDMNDVVLLQKYIAKLVSLEGEGLICGDVDASGNIEMTDVVYIQKYVAKLINEFPADGSTVVLSDSDVVIAADELTDDENTLNSNDMRDLIKHRISLIEKDWYDLYEDESEYSEYSYASFMAAYKNAVFATTDIYASFEDLRKTYENLGNAVFNLEYDAENEWDLDTVISMLDIDVGSFGKEKNNDGRYTTESWNLYISELDNAKTILENPYTYSCQAISDANSHFMYAYTTLRYEILNIGKENAYELLEKALNKYEYLTNANSDVPKKFYNIFKNSYNACKTAYENYSDYTLEQIDSLYDTLLENAISLMAILN